MGPSPWQIIVILVIVLLLFGGKKIPELMKGLGSGVKNFKKAINEEDDEDKKPENLPKDANKDITRTNANEQKPSTQA
ncbi:twin-arginine translocase TatA/TatE family subunit [Helicobacter sp. 23-1048]